MATKSTPILTVTALFVILHSSHAAKVVNFPDPRLENVIRQGETGYVVADNTPFRLADKMALLLSTPNKEENGSIRASVLDFGWPKIADTMVDEYRAVLSDYRARMG